MIEWLDVLRVTGAARTPALVRLNGLLFILIGGALFALGISLAAARRGAPEAVLMATVFLGLAFVPKGALQVLTGKLWAENPRWVRVLALVLGIPGFIALLVTSPWLVFRD